MSIFTYHRYHQKATHLRGKNFNKWWQ